MNIPFFFHQIQIFFSASAAEPSYSWCLIIALPNSASSQPGAQGKPEAPSFASTKPSNPEHLEHGVGKLNCLSKAQQMSGQWIGHQKFEIPTCHSVGFLS